jgi:Xaa-Pro aminopeptidase
VGHFVGLDVHDPSPLSTALAEGMVITIEPGVYLPDEGFGVRIEDMLLITADGARLLSAELPREAEAIERATGSAAKGRPLPR